MMEEKIQKTSEGSAVKQPKQSFEHLVRICNTDLDGNKQIIYALCKIKGVGFMLANAVCTSLGIDKKAKTGNLDKKIVEKIDAALKDPKSVEIPGWMFNRKKDYETGETNHLLGADIDFQKSNDIKRLRMIKCYKGSRHSYGLPVRGQRTKSNFRKSKTKAKGHSAIGVTRKKGKTGKV